MLNMIVAMDRNLVIGKEGKTPWQGKLRSDMEFFKKMTIGFPVVYGRKTYDSLPEKFKPLPGRQNIILTRNKDLDFPHCITASAEIILHWARHEELWIIGGGEIYNLFLEQTKHLVITHIDHEFEGDTFFPKIGSEWVAREISRHEIDEKNHFPFRIVEYTRS